MQHSEREEAEKIGKHIGIAPEYVERVWRLREATTPRAMFEVYDEEKRLIELGDPEAVKRQHEEGKLTARERVNKLLDSGSFEELDLQHRPQETGFDIGEGKGAGDGVVVGYGLVNGRPVTIWAQDATVMGGTIGTVHARKVNMIMENAIIARTPIVAIIDSEGLRAQDVIQYPDFFSTGAMARFQTIASGVIPKIVLVMGPCSGDLALIAGLGDFLFMVKNTSYMHLMPPPQGMSSQELGDAWDVHTKLTGSCDVLADNDEDCLQKCRQLLSYLSLNNTEYPPVVDTGDDPNRSEEELLDIVPVDSKKVFSMYRIISLIVDNGDFFEIKRYFARNLITGFARLHGQAVAIIANNPEHMGGCMTLDASDKMNHFVRFCDCFNIPCIWLSETPAFLPAIEEETRGLIRHGSGMIMANSQVTIPQITVNVRKRYGGSSFAMPGQNLHGDLDVAWPTFMCGAMSAESAVQGIFAGELRAITDESQRQEQAKKRAEEVQWNLDMQPREQSQKIIDPRETRPFLIKGLTWLRSRKQEWVPKKHDNIRI